MAHEYSLGEKKRSGMFPEDHRALGSSPPSSTGCLPHFKKFAPSKETAEFRACG